MEVKDMSLIEILDKNVDQSQLVKDIEAKYVSGYVDGLIAKVTSGEIDLIKGTDLDKTVILLVLNGIKNLVI